MTATETAEAPTARKGKNPLTSFMEPNEFDEGIVRLYFGPKLQATLEYMGGNPDSISEFHRTFCSRYQCTVSVGTFKKWLALCGYEFRRTVSFQRNGEQD